MNKFKLYLWIDHDTVLFEAKTLLGDYLSLDEHHEILAVWLYKFMQPYVHQPADHYTMSMLIRDLREDVFDQEHLALNPSSISSRCVEVIYDQNRGKI